MNYNQFPMDEQSIMEDSIATQRMMTNLYNNCANESAGSAVRNELLTLLHEEHEIYTTVWNEMNKRGWFSVPEADQKYFDKIYRYIQDQEKSKT